MSEPTVQPTDPVTPPRCVALPGVFNLRDLGGYHTVDQRVIRWRRVLRADGLHRCGQDELATAPVRFHTVLDLRTDTEREERGAVQSHQVTGRVLHLPVLQATWEGQGHAVDVPAEEFLSARYREMLDSGADAFRAAFEVLADPQAHPVVFHCTAGKDRTGVLAALLLSVLGVDEATIAEDYGRTREALEPFTAWLFERYPEARENWHEVPTVFLDSPPAAMTRFLDEVRGEFGSPRAYLEGIGVGDHVVASLRDTLLRDAPARRDPATGQATAPASRSAAMRAAS